MTDINDVAVVMTRLLSLLYSYIQDVPNVAMGEKFCIFAVMMAKPTYISRTIGALALTP